MVQFRNVNVNVFRLSSLRVNFTWPSISMYFHPKFGTSEATLLVAEGKFCDPLCGIVTHQSVTIGGLTGWTFRKMVKPIDRHLWSSLTFFLHFLRLFVGLKCKLRILHCKFTCKIDLCNLHQSILLSTTSAGREELIADGPVAPITRSIIQPMASYSTHWLQVILSHNMHNL